ncbi:imidazolonepropionase [Planococcus sp. 1R117A]|uniref:imidazolonepropionase n=1 Tax=Planococcus sp. 1R117A TaxID=3447020 RepID=UPI003EDC55A1
MISLPGIEVDLIIKNAAEVVTCKGAGNADLGVELGSWIAVKEGIIVGIGTEEQFKSEFSMEKAQQIDASGKVVAPGFVDCHTHLVFYGTRVEEYANKVAGYGPEELKKLGIKTGPNRTIELTRDSEAEELFRQAKKRVETMLDYGITTIESKSGYGLTTDSEIKILEIGRRLAEETPADILNTFLGAHGFPEGMSKEVYLDIIIEEMIPEIGKLGLAEFCDAWCDEGYFTAEDSEKILKAGMAYGMKPKLHADAYSYIGGSDLALSLDMVSLDHMNYTPVEVMEKLAKTNVTAVLMPALDFAVGHKKPFDARKMLDLGLEVALATDLCPASYTQSMQFVINLACRQYQFSVEEAIKAATSGGARALDLDDRGVIEAGKIADLQIWDVPTYKHIAYELGTNAVETVIKNGQVIRSRNNMEVLIYDADSKEYSR